MKISTEIGSIAKYVGEEKAIELVAKAGFDAYDLSMFYIVDCDRQAGVCYPNNHPLSGPNYREFALKLKKVADENGIICNQSHAPFPSYLKGMEEYLIRAIECTSIVGGKICVIHPCNNNDYLENAAMFKRLLPYAKKYGVKIACENMWNWKQGESHACKAACSHHDDFVKHIDEVNDEYFVACLDIGHAEMAGLDTSAVTMIHALDYRLQALHIHDNDKVGDNHQIPFSMKIDYLPIVKALKEINYPGHFTLEADAYISYHKDVDLFENVCTMAASARKLVDLYDSVVIK